MVAQYPPPPPPSNVPPIPSFVQRYKALIIGAALVFILVWVFVLTFVVKIFNRVTGDMNTVPGGPGAVYIQQGDPNDGIYVDPDGNTITLQPTG